MASMINHYKQSYRGAGKSTTTIQPEMEIVLNKQEVIYTDDRDRHVLITRLETNNRVYWIHNNEILETTDEFEEMYKVVNRDSKIDTILNEVE